MINDSYYKDYNIRITVLLSQNLADMLKELREKKNVSMATILRTALIKYFNEEINKK